MPLLLLGSVPFFRDRKFLEGIVFTLLGGIISFYALSTFGEYGIPIVLSAALGIYLSYHDLKGRTLPGRLPAAAYFISLLLSLYYQYKGLGDYLLNFSLIVMFFVTLRELSWIIFEREGLGDADPSTAPLFFFFYPLGIGIAGVFLSSFSALVHYAFLKARKEESPVVPMIPHFLIGSAAAACIYFAYIK